MKQKRMRMLKALSPFNLAYKKEFDDKQLQFYVEMLLDIPVELVSAAVELLIKTSNWLPTIAEIRSKAEEVHRQVNGIEEESWSKAWEDVCLAIKRHGMDNGLGYLDELTLATVRRVGWRNICMCDSRQLDILRAQFRDIYNAAAVKDRECRRINAVISKIPKLLIKQGGASNE